MKSQPAQNHQHRSVRITVVLMVAIGLLVFVSALLVLFLAGRAALRNTVELLHDTADITLTALEGDVEAHIRPVEDIVERYQRMVANGEIDPNDTEIFLTALKGSFAAAPQVTGIAFWDMSGMQYGLLQTEAGEFETNTYDASGNERIMAILRGDLSLHRARWQPPEFDRGLTYIFVSSGLHHNGEPLGILAAGVSLNELSKFVEKTGRDLSMTAFILYGDSDVIAHPSLSGDPPAELSEDAPLVPLSELADEVLQRFHLSEPLERARARGLILREIETEDDRYLVISRQSWAFGETVWHIGVYSPAHTVNKQLVRLIASAIGAVAVLILAVLAAILLSRYIGRPIRTLASAADSIGRLELGNIEALPRSRIKELDDQSLAFNRMLDGLKWFETYVPKRLVGRLIAGQVDPSVASREQELTVMFTDIIGFTAMSERMAPSDVGRMLNGHFETMSRCIEEEGGTLDKYIGDAVMAFWGAPEQQDDHALRACRAAMRIMEEITKENAAPSGLPRVRLKIAIHTGPLLVGNIGASARMNYTVIGDTVNTCSRIETLCSRIDDGLPAIVLVSDDTLKHVAEGAFDVAPAGSFEVKGRREPVTVSRLLGMAESRL